MINIKPGAPSRVTRIDQADADFWITDGITLVSRAAIEISDNCPHSAQIQSAIEHGWLKLVAYKEDVVMCDHQYELTLD